MSVLLDTCVIIDYIRAIKEARDYIESMEEPPYISVITITELLTGARNKKERTQIQTIIDNANVLDIDEEIAVLAGTWLNKYFKSHGVGLGDGYIAATAETHGLELATMNIKHFPMFPNIQKPYFYRSQD